MVRSCKGGKAAEEYCTRNLSLGSWKSGQQKTDKEEKI